MRSRVLVALAALLLCSGCAQLRAQLDGAEITDDSSVQYQDSLIETVDWANLDGFVSVLVRNTSDKVLNRAEAVITVLDADGLTVGSSAERTVEGGGCCTAIDVPPGGTFGFYLNAGDDIDITGVEVRYKNVSWSATSSIGGAQVELEPVDTYFNDEGTVVAARAQTVGGPVDAAIIQARLEDPDGNLVAVVSGSWTCFVPGKQRRIWMQLYQTVPEDTTIGEVASFPTPSAGPGGNANPAQECVPPGGR